MGALWIMKGYWFWFIFCWQWQRWMQLIIWPAAVLYYWDSLPKKKLKESNSGFNKNGNLLPTPLTFSNSFLPWIWVSSDVLFVFISGTSFNTHGPHGGSQSTEGVRQRSHLPYQLYLSQQWQWDLPVCRWPPHQSLAPRDYWPQLQYP